jgi:hypothetical protein
MAHVRHCWVKHGVPNGPIEGWDDVKPLAENTVYTVATEIAKDKK